jgi:asparagine synthase (glutamine-hydrolysing)
MCGIAGLFLRGSDADAAVLARMAASLGHRGPDDQGVHLDGRLGLAHTRLSIIDLNTGHQPLFAQDGDLALVANGEIYNHIELRAELEGRGYRFSTHSDCETILHAYAEYGPDCVDHLYGMFAFALYDRSRQRLVLARDRLGIKPLFLRHTHNGVAFASELKTFKALPDLSFEIAPAGLVQYLQSQFTTGRDTIVQGVERVLPGEIVTVEEGQLVQRRSYWSPRAVEPLATDFDTARERFDGLMETVMRQHMRTDVPYGLFLSGGVDSSILLALLTRYSEHPVRSFSVGFPNSSIVDELPTAEKLAARFGADHTVLEADRSAMLQRLPYAVWAADDLMQDYANLPTSMLAEVAGRERKVVFTGEGGDEVFAGYGRYRMSGLERGIRALLAPGTGGFRTRGVLRGHWPGQLYGPALADVQDAWRQPFLNAWRESAGGWSAVQRMQYTDLTTALPDNLLVKVDRMLMGWGVEGRVPFLDHRIVEFGLALPDDLKIRGNQGKTFLKRWAEGFLPHDALWKRKRGFAVPVGDWMRGAYLDRLAAVLPDHPAIRTWFRPEAVRQLADHQHRRGGVTRPLWTLLQFAVWHTLFIGGDGTVPAPMQDPLDLIS